MDTGHCKTHLRPECGDNELLPARVLHRVNDSFVLPSIDEGAVDGCLIWKDILNGLKDEAAAFFVHGRQDRWNVECSRCFRESRHVVNDHRWFVTINVRQLERLMVNQHEDTVVRREQRF